MTARRTPAPIRAIVAVFKAVFLTVRAAFAVALGAAVLGGLPWALVRFAGWPLPHHMLSAGQLKTDLTSPILGDQFYLNAIAIVLWFLWSILAFSFLLELIYAVRRIPAPHVPGLGPAQLLAGFLITAIGVTALLGRSAAPARAEVSTVVPKARTATTAPATISTPSGLRSASALPVRESVHHVVPGDSLYKIAEQDLGDGQDWPALFKANAGVVQHDGQRLSDPNLILPGWDITIPGAATMPATAAPAPALTPQVAAPVTTIPATPAPDTRSATVPSHPVPSPAHQAPTAPEGSAPSSSRPVPTAPARSVGERPAASSARHADGRGGAGSGLWIELAGGGVIAASTLLALRAAAGRRHKLRSLWANPYWPRPGEVKPLDTPQMPRALRPARTIPLTSAEPQDTEELVEISLLDAFGAPADATTPRNDQKSEIVPPGAMPAGQGREPYAQAGEPTQAAVLAVPSAPDADQDREDDAPVWMPVAVTSDGTSVGLADLFPGLGLSGPGALGAARAIAAAVLSSRSPEEFGSILLIPRADAALLLDVPEAQVDQLCRDVWHLRIAEDLDAAVTDLAMDAAARNAALADNDVPDFEALAEIDELLDDPEPVVLLAVTRGAPDERTKASLVQPQHLRLHSVLLGAHPAGANWRIDADGEVLSGAAETGVYAFNLSTAGLRSALDVVTGPADRPLIVATDPRGPLAAPDSIEAAAIDEPNDAAPTEPADASSLTDTDGSRAGDADEHVGTDRVPAEADNDEVTQVEQPHGAGDDPSPFQVGAEPAREPSARDDAESEQHRRSGDGAASSAAPPPAPVPDPPRASAGSAGSRERFGAGLARLAELDADDAGATLKQIQEILQRFSSTPCQIRVLGPSTLTTFTGPVEGNVREGSRKLAVLLALHHARGRSTKELGVLWPDVPEGKLAHIRKNDLYDLRRSLKRDILAGRGPRHGYAAEFVPRRSGRYHLDLNYVGVDLACFEQLRAITARATDTEVRKAAATAALSLYSGELAEGMDEDWMIAPRVAVRRDALATASLLAQLATEAGDDERALTWWERARSIDDNEEVYRQIMKAQGRLGRRADIIATRDLLEQKLEPLGESASHATRMVLAELLSEQRGIPRDRIGTP
ncbi:BTAD domain-containing putative transcriptional regulator [Catenulispora subtropica]|uniref:BTAD domain-containing putative transcriptional regulator n=1 Tax=Catenulispora subtropica TaxID=450798 RepID=UPI0031DA3817